jgi:uncharacterized RDD family membrane protein YckC
MTVAGAAPVISILRPGGSIETLRWTEDGLAALNPLGALDVRRIALIADAQRAILWAAPEAGAGRIYFLRDEWSDPKWLEMTDPPRADEPRAIAFAGNNIRLLFLRERTLFEQIFDDSGAAARAEATALPAAPPRSDTTPNRILTLAAAAMLMIVVLGTLRRTGTEIPATTTLAPGLVLAPLIWRFVAGVIDLLPFLVPCWFVFSRLDATSDDAAAVMAATSWPVYAALGGYLLYTWLFEALLGRTVGKMIFGLRVVALDGSRPTRGAILARNALRLVDVTMVAVPLVLVILSPLRQRVGDIAARTVVVSGVLESPEKVGAEKGQSADESA